jgi:hypothetical protein
LNDPEFPDRCRRVDLSFLEDVPEVLANRSEVLLEQLGEKPLRQPDGPAVEADLDAAAPVLPRVEHQLRRARLHDETVKPTPLTGAA